MGIVITRQGEQVINDFLKDSPKQRVRLAKEGWSIESGLKSTDGILEFRKLDSRLHLYSVKDLRVKGNEAYFDKNHYYLCETNQRGERVVPECEIDFNTTTSQDANPSKARILMAALYPSEVNQAFRKQHAAEITALQNKLKTAGMKIPGK